MSVKKFSHIQYCQCPISYKELTAILELLKPNFRHFALLSLHTVIRPGTLSKTKWQEVDLEIKKNLSEEFLARLYFEGARLPERINGEFVGFGKETMRRGGRMTRKCQNQRKLCQLQGTFTPKLGFIIP